MTETVNARSEQTDPELIEKQQLKNTIFLFTMCKRIIYNKFALRKQTLERGKDVQA